MLQRYRRKLEVIFFIAGENTPLDPRHSTLDPRPSTLDKNLHSRPRNLRIRGGRLREVQLKVTVF